MIAAVPGQPNIIRDLRGIHFCGEFRVIAIYDRSISGRRHLLAERVDNIRQLLDRKIHNILGFHIHRQRVRNLIRRRHLHRVPGRRPGFLHRPRLEINVGRCMDAVGLGLPHIHVIILIHGVLALISEGAHPDQREGNIIRRDLSPIHVSLPLGNTNSPQHGSLDRSACIIHINAVHLFPRHRIHRLFPSVFRSGSRIPILCFHRKSRTDSLRVRSRQTFCRQSGARRLHRHRCR